MEITENIKQRFFNGIDKSGGDDACWPWTKGKFPGGHGAMWIKESQTNFTANRVSWEIHKGKIPTNAWVRHTCEEPSCCNPKHLYLDSETINEGVMKRFFDGLEKERGEDSCWPWKKSCDGLGYGLIFFGRSMIRSHRLAYLLFNGQIPKGKLVLHSCDNPPCCNPKHLRIGTNLDNARDQIERNRFVIGENHPKAKLTENDVRFIRYFPHRKTRRELSVMFKVSINQISMVLRCKNWKHVTSLQFARTAR